MRDARRRGGAAVMTVGPVLRDEATAAFLDAAANGQFLLRACPDGHYSEPTAQQCRACGSAELAWAPAAGGATVVSWAVAHGAADDGDPDPRTILVIAQFDEGPWWWSQVVGAEPRDVAVGTRLRVTFCRPDDQHEAVPVFVVA